VLKQSGSMGYEVELRHESGLQRHPRENTPNEPLHLTGALTLFP
jgi:hypothetical protein